MPAATSQAQGQPFKDTLGGHFYDVVDWNGPTAYVGGTGEALDPAPFGMREVMSAYGSISVSGTYYCLCQPVNAGITKWVIQYYTAATGAQLGAGPTNLSAEVFKITAYGA